MSKRSFFWLLLLVALAGSLFAIKLVLSVRQTINPPAAIVEPPRAPFPASIGARGLIESVDENVRIAPAIAALVVEVPVKVGDEVKKGGVLIRQDTRDASAAIATQQAEIAALRTEVQEAQVALDDKRDMADRVSRLLATKVASDEEKQRTYFAVKAAEAHLASIHARIASAEAMLARMEVQRDLLVIRAPRDGQVLQVNTRAGEFAGPADRDPMILLGQVKRLQLRADVDEDNASRVRENMPAVAFIKGHRDQKIPLTFVRIEPYILPKRSLTGESSERVDTRVLQIIYHFERPPGLNLYVGQQMDVFLDGKPEGK